MSTDLPRAFELAQAIELLRRTPAALQALLGGLDAAWLTADEGPGTWTCMEVVAHLVDLEDTDWMTRARVILGGDEAAAFAPIDRERFRRVLDGRSLGALLETFADRRRRNLADLEALELTTADLARRARHPDFGLVTLGQLLSTWTVHDLTHLAQIARVMAKHYQHDVGPWRAYLGVLAPERGPRS